MASFAALRLSSASLLFAACLYQVRSARIDIGSLKRLADGSGSMNAAATERDAHTAGVCEGRTYYATCDEGGLHIESKKAKRYQKKYQELKAKCEQRWTIQSNSLWWDDLAPCQFKEHTKGEMKGLIECVPSLKGEMSGGPGNQDIMAIYATFDGHRCGNDDTEQTRSFSNQLMLNALAECQQQLCMEALRGDWCWTHPARSVGQTESAKTGDWPEKSSELLSLDEQERNRSYGWSEWFRSHRNRCQMFVNGFKVFNLEDHDKFRKQGWIEKKGETWIFNKAVCSATSPISTLVKELAQKEPSVYEAIHSHRRSA